LNIFVNSPQTIIEYKDKWGVLDEQWKTIDWDSLEQAYQEVELGKQ